MLWPRSFWNIRSISSRASSLLQGPWWACWLCGSRLAGDAVAPIILEHRVDIIASKLAPTGGVVGMLALWEPAAGDAVGPVILEHRVDSIASKLAPTGVVVGMLALWEPACRRCFSPGHSGASGRHHRRGAVGMLPLWEPACRRCCSPGHSGSPGRYHREQAHSCRLGVEPGC